MMYRRCAWPALVLLVCFILAGCASSANPSNDDQHGGFYGGVSGGMTTRP